MVSSILSKNEQKNWLYYNGTLSRIVFVRLLGELKIPKIYFEINWPLSGIKTFKNTLNILNPGVLFKSTSFFEKPQYQDLKVP